MRPVAISQFGVASEVAWSAKRAIPRLRIVDGTRQAEVERRDAAAVTAGTRRIWRLTPIVAEAVLALNEKNFPVNSELKSSGG